MLSEKLNQALYDQINFELYSAHIYLAMSAYVEAQDLEGFGHFFRIQYREEVDHGLKMFNFVNSLGGSIEITGFENPEKNFTSLLNVFETALAHEKIVTSRIYNIKSIAVEEKNYAVSSFIDWYINEQVEEEETFTKYIKRLKLIEKDPAAIYVMDQELGARVWTPLPEAQI